LSYYYKALLIRLMSFCRGCTAAPNRHVLKALIRLCLKTNVCISIFNCVKPIIALNFQDNPSKIAKKAGYTKLLCLHEKLVSYRITTQKVVSLMRAESSSVMNVAFMTA